jgi:hypothetical protein
MIYCWNGNTAIRAWSLSYGISYSVDNEISPPYPESWRTWVFVQTFSEGIEEHAGVRDRELSCSQGPHTHGDGDSAAVCGERGDRAVERADGEYSEEKVWLA